MSDDIIQFPQKPGPAQVSADGIPEIALNVPEGFPQFEAGSLGFSDMDAAFNMRDWLRKACEAQGGKFVGGGFGMGQADIDIELEGCRFNISIRPLS